MDNTLRVPMFSTFAAMVDCLHILLGDNRAAALTKSGAILKHHRALVDAASWADIRSTGLIDAILHLAPNVEAKEVRNLFPFSRRLLIS